MTAITSLNSNIHLDNLYKHIQINETIPFLQHGSLGTKGTSNKAKKKPRKEVKRNTFFNQVTIHVHCGKLVNVKLFNNGKVQMTGLKYESHGSMVLKTLLPLITPLKDVFTTNHVEHLPMNIVLINSDFDIGYKIQRDVLHRQIVDEGMYSSYEPCIYPGVNIKYYYNLNQSNGICKCSAMCVGKGDGSSDGECKRITIAVFKSGKIIITGARSRKHLEISYYFITKFINDRKVKIELK